MTDFVWLHLTDLHLGMRGLDDLWPTLEQDLFADLEFLVGREQAGPLDLVLFTGDLVQRGSASEFQMVDRLLERFWTKFEEWGFAPKLLAIPGNHDLARPKSDNPSLISMMNAWIEVKDIFLERSASPYRKLVEVAFRDYIGWWDGKSAQGVPARFKPSIYCNGFLPGEFAATLEKDEIRLGIVGLNSTFLQLTGGSLEGKLELSERQFHETCRKAGRSNGPDWVGSHDACFLLTHQPEDWLTDQGRSALNEVIHAPPEQFALHLFGHMHDPKFVSTSMGAAKIRRRLQGCSLFGMEGWGSNNQDRKHGYSVGQLRIDGNTAKMRIFPREAVKNQDNSWKFDRDRSFTLRRGKEATDWMSVALLRKRRVSPPITSEVQGISVPPSLANPSAEYSRAIVAGLTALASLIEQCPSAREAARQSQSGFHDANRQIAEMLKYKSLHGQLHFLQFKCYAPIIRESGNLEGNGRAFKVLALYVDNLAEILDELEKITRAAVFPDFDLNWIGELREAYDMMRSALVDVDSDRIETASREFTKAVRILNRVLVRYPSRINDKLYALMGDLPLPHLESSMNAVYEAVSNPIDLAIDDIKLHKALLKSGMSALSHIGAILFALLGEHNVWQKVDVELRQVEANLEWEIEPLLETWEYIERLAGPLYTASTAPWAKAIMLHAKNLQRAVKQADTDASKGADAKKLFRRYSRAVGLRFLDVDTQLLSLCNDLHAIESRLSDIEAIQ